MPSVIRAATQTDFDVLVQLSTQTIHASYTTFLGKDSVDGFIGSGEVDRYVRSNLRSCWVIEVDEATVGYCVVKENRLDLMMIDHRYHRRGFGSKLLLYAEQELFKEHHEIVLESFEPNGVANAFYRHHGWVEVGRRPDAKAGVNMIEFRKGRS